MKRLAVVAVVLALMSLGVSAWALKYSYDANHGTSSPTHPVTTTTVKGATTTTTTPAVVTIPSVVGKNGFNAGAGLGGVGLKTKILRAPSVSVPKNYVIAQSPLPGTEVPRGTVITLTLSSGPASG